MLRRERMARKCPNAYENTQYASPPANCVKGKWAISLPTFSPFKAGRHPRQFNGEQSAFITTVLSGSQTTVAQFSALCALPMSHTGGQAKSIQPITIKEILEETGRRNNLPYAGLYLSHRVNIHLESFPSPKQEKQQSMLQLEYADQFFPITIKFSQIMQHW